MKTRTIHQVVLSVAQMKAIVAKMETNLKHRSDLSGRVRFNLDYDTDNCAYILDEENGYQFSDYAECIGENISINN
jgi:hypothetical protein